MNQPIASKYVRLLLLAVLYFLCACTNSKKAPPFPILENEYRQPTIKSFEFSNPDTLKFTAQDAAKIKALPSIKFDWAKLPAKALDIGIPYKLKKPLATKVLDWKNLPTTPFDLDSLPVSELKVKVTPLGVPTMSKAGYPASIANTTRGVMGVDFNFGLPGAPHSLLKNKTGMLWFGTTGSIAKYDSENIEIYGSEQGLDIGVVYSLFEDSKGRLWVGNTKNTITVIDFEAQLVFELSSSFELGTIYGIMEAKDGTFWFSNNGYGYNIIDLSGKTMRQFDTDHGLLDTFTITPFQDHDGLIWLSTAEGINILSLKEGTNRTLTAENGLLSNATVTFFQDEEDRLWIGNVLGVSIVNGSKTEISYFTEEQGLDGIGQITDIFKDRGGNLWIGSDNGMLFSYSEPSATLERYVISNNRSQVVYNTLEDAQGQIWTAIVQGGVYKIDPNNGRPGNFTSNDGLGNNAFWSTLEAKDGKIWLGSYGGIDIYDPETRTVKHLGKEQGLVSDRDARLLEDSQGRIWSCGSSLGISIIDPQKETIQHLTGSQGLETNSISTILEVENDTFWLGGPEGEILTVNLANSDFKYTLPTQAELVFQNNIMVKDKNGVIWIGGLGSGIQKIDSKNNTRVLLTEAEGLISNQVFSLALGGEDGIWAATDKGVVNINLSTNELTTFTTAEGLGANDVYAVKAHKGEIFVGTSKGLSIIKPMMQDQEHPYYSVRTYGKWQGLNFVDFAENSFTFDKNGRFWAGVDAQILTVMDPFKDDTLGYQTFITGINVLDKKQNFTKVDLLKEKRAKIDTLLLSAKERLLLASAVVKDTGYLAENKIEWKSVEGPYGIPVGLILPHTQNYLSFDFNGMQFSNPDKRVYRYFLEGIDKNWGPISDKAISENYRDLPPGDYTFKVASKGFNGVWSQPAELPFTILPPWWRTLWAYAIYASLFLLALYGVDRSMRQRIKRKERERTRDKELAQAKEIEKAYSELKNTQSQLVQSEKMASLGELTAGIAHEIQNPLNFVNNFSEVNSELIAEMKQELIKGNLEEAKNLANDIDENEKKIIFHGKRADSIVKGMLQHSRSSSGQKEPTDINALADEYLRLAYHGLRAKDKSFNATMKTDFDPAINHVNVIPQEMGRVILNLITNAFYVVQQKKQQIGEGYDPTVSVSTQKKGDTVEISVKDNGNGIPNNVKDKIFQPFFTTKPTGQGTGLGLSMSYDIVTKGHGGTLTVQTKENQGTTFIISLPSNPSNKTNNKQ